MKTLVLVVLLSLFSSNLKADEFCKSAWSSVAEMHSEQENMKVLLSDWKAKKDICKESSFYYLKLGWLLVENSNFQDAEKAFNKGLESDAINKELLLLGLAELPFQQATRTFSEIDTQLLREAEKRMLAFVESYPESSYGYASLTGLMLVKKDYQSVIEYGSKAVKLEENAFAYRNLAIANYEVGKDRDATILAAKAIEHSSSLEADPELMLSIALAYSNLKEFRYSLGILRLLAKSNPEYQTSTEFQKVTAHIREEYLSNQEKQNK